MQKRGFIGPAVVVLVAILSIAGLIGLGIYIGKKSSGPTATNPVVTQTASPSPADETTNWKTYKDANDGYSIKYPSDFTIQVESSKDRPGHSDVTLKPQKSNNLIEFYAISVGDIPANISIPQAIEKG